MRIIVRTTGWAIPGLIAPAIILLAVTPALGLDLNLGVANVSIGSDSDSTAVGISALGGAAEIGAGLGQGSLGGLANVGVSLGGAGGGTPGLATGDISLGGQNALAKLEASTMALDLSADAATADALMGIAGTAAGIDLSAAVLTTSGLASLCVGTCGGTSSGTTTGSSNGAGSSSRVSAFGTPSSPLRSRPRCDNGQGNTSAFNGYSVVDREGTRLGLVHAATIGQDLSLTTVQMLADAGPGTGEACVLLGGVRGQIGGARQVQTGVSAWRVRQIIAGSQD